jgi:pimeloyl-ACP methyl ester carboxylesterase
MFDGVSVKRHYAEGRFGQIHYRMAAPTHPIHPPLVCLHMSPYSGVVYESFLKGMANDRVAIALDTPGFGGSDPPDFSPTIGDYALALKDLLDSLDFSEVDVMGYHTGGKIALEAAIAFPSSVRRVVLVSAAIWPDGERDVIKNLYAREHITHDGSHLLKWWRSAVKWSMLGRSLEKINEVFWSRTLNPEISWWGHNAAINYNTQTALLKITHPILVLNPEDDLWEYTLSARSLLKNPKSYVHNLPRWGHGFLDVRTEEAVSIVNSFLH